MLKKIKSINPIMLFLLTIIIVGILSGILYYLLQNENVRDNMLFEFNKIDFIKRGFNYYHIYAILVIYLLSYTIIGFIPLLFYLYYLSLSLGLSMTLFILNYGFLGFLYGFLYFILTKFIFLVCILYLIYISIIISIKIIKCIKDKNNNNFLNIFKLNIKRFLIVLGVIIVNEVFTYYIGIRILKWFLFLL